jgi:SAM-dependent methyltransferase
MPDSLMSKQTLTKNCGRANCDYNHNKCRLYAGKIYETLFPTRVYPIRQALSGCKSVLDIGCGTGDLMAEVNKEGFYAVGVDLFKPYLTLSKEKNAHNEIIMGDIETLEFKPKSFDAVMAMGVIEHLEKNKGNLLINKMKKWARKKVLLITPNGYVTQHEYDENPFQIHKSGWTIKELNALCFRVYGMGGLCFLKGEKAEVRLKPKILWEVISDMTQKITYRYPTSAFELLCVKTLDCEDL